MEIASNELFFEFRSPGVIDMPGFFWVNQGGTYKDEKAAGCLWAPERDGHGSTLNHWETMTSIQPGDIIFTYANGQLRGHAVATSVAAPMARPYSSGSAYLPSQGGRVVFCDYTVTAESIPFSSISTNPDLKRELSDGRNAVLNSVGTVAQKYLCQISPTAAAALAKLLGISVLASASLKTSPPISKTTVQQLVDARLGQGKFRQDLLEIFGNRCPITGLTEPKLIIASHIQPWCESSNIERLDPENGLLLAAGIDAAFDGGFVGFGISGNLLLRSGINPTALTALGFPPGAALPFHFLTPKRLAYLQYHRQKFKL